MSGTFVNSMLAVSFVIIALILTFLMYSAWKYPFDHQRLRSEAPTWMIRLHRWLGLVYVLLYVYLMWEMVPRLWDYQLELPARTVMHLTVGMAIGAILVAKLAVVRFFKHLEAKLVPFLGTSLLIGSILLTFLALPFALREIYLSGTVLGIEEMTDERVGRIRAQLPRAGIEDPALINRLARKDSLEFGRRVLTRKCTQCHDLRTVLARPRTPVAWRQTVARMADRSTILNPITQNDELMVTAYLIAVSPTLQQGLKQRRELQSQSARSQQAFRDAREAMTRGRIEFDLDSARRTFEATCSQCHSPKQVELTPPTTFEEVVVLVQRMVGNGLMATETELDQVIYYLTETYVEPNAGGTAAPPASTTERAAAPDAPGEQGPDGGLSPATERGETLFQRRGCAGCHGRAGRSPIGPHIPRIAGQNKHYLVQQLKDIKSGARDNGSTALMAGIAAGLSDEEIAALAGYLSSLDWSAR